ncbi:DUF6452 family protein [Lutibacter sp.]|uniref:DUF6452 family protein n=1 Tax=Lutibacter sp. TaxID=1925666 RepID=UPI001A200A6D|nr:DUF6452 family protein [Lutibacter sp.]MBI9041464.1 hypothetical protein [Lutibacter sp.]
MKKYSIVLVILLLVFSNCEKDDICIEATTPNLIIRFYDTNNPETIKAVSSLTVAANEKEDIYTNVSLDSIIIPLNLAENSTTYKFKSGTKTDEIIFNYERKDVFVSRSCGYKTIFENLTVQTTNEWITNYIINNSTIENETNAHINIYH